MNMKNELISIIIPAYNNEKYIGKCIESVLNQTYQNIEIIIINDCSTDNTEDVIHKYLIKDDRISYYRNENNIGVGYTRNKGIELAKGKYIYFLDSDDYIEPNAIFDLYNVIKEDDSFSSTTSGFKEINGESMIYRRTKEELDLLQSPSVCIRLFNKSIIDKSNIKFSNLKIGEDLEFVFKLLIFNDKVSYINKPIYTYVIHNDSSIHKSNENQMDVLKAIDTIEKYAKKRNQYDKFFEKLEFVNISHILIGTTKRIQSFDKYNKEDITKCIEIVNKKYPNWKKNKYINKYLSKNKDYLLNL